MKKADVIKAAKALNLYVTDNHNAITAAKSLLEANKRLIELEQAIALTDSKRQKAALTAYFNKWVETND